MKNLQEYVDELFYHQQLTPEVEELKEEILSNMIARRDDLIAQGVDFESATKQAEESLSEIDFLIDGNQWTDIGKYRLECRQTILFNSIIFWILSFPLLIMGFGLWSYVGLIAVLISGCVYILEKKRNICAAGFLSVKVSKEHKKMAWILWMFFFLITGGTIAAITFGSNLWFGRPIQISGPYEMATIAVRFYLPLSTILIPMTFSSCSKILLKSRKGLGDE